MFGFDPQPGIFNGYRSSPLFERVDRIMTHLGSMVEMSDGLNAIPSVP